MHPLMHALSFTQPVYTINKFYHFSTVVGKLHSDLCMFSVYCVFLFSFSAIKEKYSDWTEFLVQDLTGSRTAPSNLLEGVGIQMKTVDLSF